LWCSKNKYNELEYSELNLRAGQIRSIMGCPNLSDEEINMVLNFLIELAKLEIKIQEINKSN